MVKDLVRLNPATVQLWNGEKWTQVLGWNELVDASHRVEIVLRSGERIGCTAPHQWPTQRGVVRTADLVVGDVISTCTLPEPTGAARPEYLTQDSLWFVGLYLAEGSMSGETIQISSNTDELRFADRIDRIARHYGGSSTHAVDGNNLSIRVYCRVLRAILENYIGGTDAESKHMKVAAWSLPNADLREMIGGYLDGDGHADQKWDRVRLGFCRNYSLERDLRTAAARLGTTLTLNPSTATNQDGEYPCFHGEWRWTRSGHHNEKDRGEVVEINKGRARRFWDIGVEDEPHLFALASGVLTHNSKPNAKPESVTDRPTKAHEYLFLMSKSAAYYYDADAIREQSVGQNAHDLTGSGYAPPGQRPSAGNRRSFRGGGAYTGNHSFQNSASKPNEVAGNDGIATARNRRSVWTVATHAFPGAHFACFPPALIEPCILAGSRPGDIVLDPFNGSGTTGEVSLKHRRRYVGVELNADYLELSKNRFRQGVLFGATP